MIKRLSYFFLIIVVVLCLLWWLGIDLLVRSLIESEGSKQYGAEINVASAEMSLFNRTLKLQGVQATNAADPAKNLVAVDTIDTNFELLPLLRKKLFIEQLNLDGIQVNSDRSSPGFVLKKPDSQTSALDSAKELFDKLGAADISKIKQSVIEQTNAELKTLESTLKAAEDQWKNRIDALPDEDTLKGYKQEFKQLKESDPITQISGIGKLGKQVKGDLNTITQLKEQLSLDKKLVNSQIDNLKNLPQQQLNQVLAGLNIDSATVTQLLAKENITALIRQFKQLTGSAEKTSPEASTNTTDTVPDLLIKTGALSGTLFNGITFKGEFSNLTHQLERLAEPLNFSLDGGKNQQNLLTINGILDHTMASAKDYVKINVDKLPINDFSFSPNDKLTMNILSAISSITGSMTLENNQINLNLDSILDKLDIDILSASDKKTAELLQSAINASKKIAFSLKANGSADNPSVHFRSNLDRAISGAIKQGLAQELDDVSQQIESEIKTKLQSVENYKNALDGFEQKLKDKQSLLKELI